MENKTKKKGLPDRIPSSRVFRVMFSRKIIVVCAILLLIMGLIAIFAPMIAPYDPNKDDLYHVLKGCSAEHWLGTDSNGRDVLSRIIYGARISFTVGIVAVVDVYKRQEQRQARQDDRQNAEDHDHCKASRNGRGLHG